ncbi:hypothetical protein [Lysobacter gummosus]|uniref:hypothetical protein n=1 Tax=Lysobacter gummosus TaxID=262324 RepID=UPI00362EAB4F
MQNPVGSSCCGRGRFAAGAILVSWRSKLRPEIPRKWPVEPPPRRTRAICSASITTACVRWPSACARAAWMKWSASAACSRPARRCAARSNPDACTR